LQQLPIAKLVQTPDGIPNELFGDVIMLTEFISCYRGLLMPDDNTTITSGLLSTCAYIHVFLCFDGGFL
jgi:hypothetical protein